MTTILTIMLVVFIAGFVLILREMKKTKGNGAGDQALLLLQQQMTDLAKTLDARIDSSTGRMLSQSDKTMETVKNITAEIAKMSEGQKQIGALNDQLKGLNDILKNTKQRGELGEHLLVAVLRDVFAPGMYELQHPFKDGTKVDAILRYGDWIIPVDSKFSLENYNRFVKAATDEERKRYEDALRMDLKTRIDETSKYIKPTENTVDFAFMFIPSEALYYDLLVNKIGTVAERDLIQYAAEKRVYPVSPTTFYAYLRMALQGMQQIEINKSAEVIRKNVGELQKHLARYEEYLEKIGTHLSTTKNAYDAASKEFTKIDKDILKIEGTSEAQNPEKLL